MRVTNLLRNKIHFDLKSSENNYDLFNIIHLLNTIVIFQKTKIKHCRRCQLFSHTANYCNLSIRCIKYAGKHGTKMCNKSDTEPAKCALFDGDHPASYKGYSVYKQRSQFYKTHILDVQPQINIDAPYGSDHHLNQHINKNGQSYKNVAALDKINI